eukprot:gene2747-biopygen2265
MAIVDNARIDENGFRLPFYPLFPCKEACATNVFAQELTSLERPLDVRGHITTLAFTGSAVTNRLKKHMQHLSIFEGETAHGLRSGCSITLALLGVPHLRLPLLSAGSTMVWSLTTHTLTGSSRFTTQDPGLLPKLHWAPLQSALTSEL